jgi:hypothetical protein
MLGLSEVPLPRFRAMGMPKKAGVKRLRHAYVTIQVVGLGMKTTLPRACFKCGLETE